MAYDVGTANPSTHGAACYAVGCGENNERLPAACLDQIKQVEFLFGLHDVIVVPEHMLTAIHEMQRLLGALLLDPACAAAGAACARGAVRCSAVRCRAVSEAPSRRCRRRCQPPLAPPVPLLAPDAALL